MSSRQEAPFIKGIQTVAGKTRQLIESFQPSYHKSAERCGEKIEKIFDLFNNLGIEPTTNPLTDLSKTFTFECIDPVVDRRNPLNAFLKLGTPEVSVAITDWDIQHSHYGPGVKILSVLFTKIVDGNEVAVQVTYDSKSAKPTPEMPWLDPLEISRYPSKDLNIPKAVANALRPFNGMDDPRFTESTEKLETSEALIKIAERLVKPKINEIILTDPQETSLYPTSSSM